MARRTKEEAQATREHLLDCAEQVFLQRGVSHTSLQDVADAAGVTRGAIYWHFGDKPALFDAMTARVELPLEQVLACIQRDSERDPLVLLRRLALQPLELLARDPRARRVFTILFYRVEFVGEMAPIMRRHEQALAQWLQLCSDLFTRARDAGALRGAVEPRQAATALLALVNGLLGMAAFDADPVPTEQAAPAAIDALLAGLRGA